MSFEEQEGGTSQFPPSCRISAEGPSDCPEGSTSAILSLPTWTKVKLTFLQHCCVYCRIGYVCYTWKRATSTFFSLL